jgi:protein ImuB
MTVPSYEDLTPGIPDVAEAETAGNLASLLRERRVASSPLPASGAQHPGAALYACLRLGAASATLEAVLAIAHDFSPRVRRASAREVVLDVSGLGGLIGPPAEIARQLAQALLGAGIAASVALGQTQVVARLLAQADAGQTGGSCAPLPVRLLQELETLPPGITDRDRARIYETLERWGIATLGDLAALPAAGLSSRLGRRGAALQRLAQGLDASPFVPDAGTPRYVGRLELEWPIDALEPLSFVLARLLEPLTASLERADRGAAAIRLDLRLTDRSTHARLLQLPAAIREARVLRTLLLLDLESSLLFTAARDAMIDVVAIELDPAPARITQFSLLHRALPSPETLATLTARLSALVGESRVGAPVLIETHRPGGFGMVGYEPGKGAEGANGAKGAEGAGAKGANGAKGAEGAGAKGANGAKGAEGAGAKGANGGKGAEGAGDGGGVPRGVGGAVLRRERRSVALSVRVEHGRPVYIASSQRGVPYGAVVQAAGPWRTSGEWWSDERWNRNEWDVALKSGAVCRIHQDRTTEQWLFEGTYD